MKSNSRIRHGLLIALAIVCKSHVDAFTLPPLSTVSHQNGLHQAVVPLGRPSIETYMSSVEVEYETSIIEQPLLSDATAAADASSLQSRTLSPNFLINSSILLIAIVTILYQVLSVDLGITRGWNAEEIAARIPLDNWRSYTNVLNMAPLQTKAVTSATVYTIGDILSQTKEGKDMGELDRGRIVRSLLAGLIGHGPMSHVWYHVSEDFFDGVLVGHHWWDFIPKVVVDQVSFET